MPVPWGPIIMGGSALAGSLMSLLGRKEPERTTQIPRFDQPQQEAMRGALGMGMEGLRDPYAGFEPIAQQARSRFQSQTMPSLMERFGGLGATRSSGYKGLMAGAGEDFEQQLAAMRAQYGLQNRSSLMQLLGLGLQPQFENIYRPETAGGMQMMGAQLAGAGLGGLGTMLGGQYLSGLEGQRQGSAIEAWEKQQDLQRAHELEMQRLRGGR